MWAVFHCTPQFIFDLCDLCDLLTLKIGQTRPNKCIFLLFSPLRTFCRIDRPNRKTSTSDSFLTIRVPPVTFSPDCRKMAQNRCRSKKSASRWIEGHAKVHRVVKSIFAFLTLFGVKIGCQCSKKVQKPYFLSLSISNFTFKDK